MIEYADPGTAAARHRMQAEWDGWTGAEEADQCCGVCKT